MGWVKLDDHFFDNPKVVDVSIEGKLMYLAGLAHCAAHLTDGRVSGANLRRIGRELDVKRPGTRIKELAAAGLLEDHGEDAYRVHDYLVYNPSRSQVLYAREQDRKRKFRGGNQAESQRHPSRNPSGSRPESKQDSRGNPGGVQSDSKRRVVNTYGINPSPPPDSVRTAGGQEPVPAGEDDEPFDAEAGKAHLAGLREKVADPPRGLRKAASKAAESSGEPPPESPPPDHSEEPF